MNLIYLKRASREQRNTVIRALEAELAMRRLHLPVVAADDCSDEAVAFLIEVA